MNVAIRVDASSRIGHGHRARCSALAHALHAHGAEIQMICADMPGESSRESRDDAPWQFARIDAPAGVTGDNAPAETLWSRPDQLADARRTRATWSTHAPDVLIVDHYGLDATWESELANDVEQIVVIDDLANRRHRCDVLVDSGIRTLPHSDYASLVPDDTRLLSGPRYALLTADYAQRHRRIHAVGGPVRRVLIAYGTTRTSTPAQQAIRVLSRPEFSALALDIIVNDDPTIRSAVDTAARVRGQTTVHVRPDGLGHLLERCDIAIGAGGVTSWERMCLGVPSIIASVADNQRHNGEVLDELGVAVYLGPVEACRDEHLTDALSGLMADAERRADMSRRGMAQVDGQGAGRVAIATLSGTLPELTLRPAARSDLYSVLALTNDPEVRRNSLTTTPVSVNDHVRWFEDQLRDPAALLLIVESGPITLGQVRFHSAGTEDVLSYSLDAAVRGRGWGREIVRMGCRELRKRRRTPVRAIVRADNAASHRIFASLGFNELDGPEPGLTTYHLPADRDL